MPDKFRQPQFSGAMLGPARIAQLPEMLALAALRTAYSESSHTTPLEQKKRAESCGTFGYPVWQDTVLPRYLLSNPRRSDPRSVLYLLRRANLPLPAA